MKNSTAFIGSVLALVAFLFPALASASQVDISMTDGAFAPQTLTINQGDTVVWVNNGVNSHEVFADGGLFTSSAVSPRGTYGYTFTTTGTFQYHDPYYGSAGGNGMAGTIIVVPANAVAVPVVTSTPVASGNTAQLTAQIQSLLAEITALQQQAGTSGAVTTPVYTGTTGVSSATSGVNASACPLIGRALGLGSSGDDVSRLQQFLARDASIYPEGQITGYYGTLTQTAVERWQTKYNIVSSGSPATTGYGVVGPRTAAAISLQCSTMGAGTSTGTGATTGTGTQTPVGGFIQVTPITGNAPLSVTVNATVNTTTACGGATYTLSYGDNTVPQTIIVQPGNCQQETQTFTHVYPYGGTFLVTLSAGSHQTSATVTVYGASISSTQVSGQVVTQGLPAETFNTSPSSGSAPLSVTFSGTVNSNDAGFVQGGSSDTLDFGDGTIASVALPSTVGGWLSYSILHTYAAPGGYRAVLHQGGINSSAVVGNATITVSGSAASYTPPSLSVVADSSGNLDVATLSFNLLSSCDQYQVSWGDGTTPAASGAVSGTVNCQTGATTPTLVHTYAGAGTYTITLERGPSLSQVDTVAVTIQ
jgi:plastocyanin